MRDVRAAGIVFVERKEDISRKSGRLVHKEKGAGTQWGGNRHHLRQGRHRKDLHRRGVAACLAAMGHRTLCLDGDIGLRNLDLVLGMTDQA